jgi:2-dehydro-3-deoxyphosphooctonate aldolase (KDO 8-P synthase)
VTPARVGELALGGGGPLFLIAGPCAIEGEAHAMDHAAALRDIARAAGVPFIYKSSFDKANRQSLSSSRGAGLAEGLRILARVRREIGVPVLTDIHETSQASAAAEAVDVIQIPAFLCRQTDLVLAAAATGRALNLKKGQFVAPQDMRPIVEKAEAGGAKNILVTERGFQFGYQNLVVDMRSIPVLRSMGRPVVFDAGHSVQRPGAGGGKSGGEREMIPVLARAAVAAGCDGLFVECHRDPDRAPSDGPNMLRLEELPALLGQLTAIRAAVGPRP